MKNKLIIGLILVLLLSLAGNYFLNDWWQKSKADVSRLSQNNSSLLYAKDSIAQVLVMNESEIKTYVDENPKLRQELHENKIKLSRLQWLLETTSHLKDTVYKERIITLENPDSLGIMKLKPFKTDCLIIEGEVDIPNQKLIITKIDQPDSTNFIAHIVKIKTGEKFLLVFNKKRKVLQLDIESNCRKYKSRYIEIKKE